MCRTKQKQVPHRYREQSSAYQWGVTYQWGVAYQWGEGRREGQDRSMGLRGTNYCV